MGPRTAEEVLARAAPPQQPAWGAVRRAVGRPRPTIDLPPGSLVVGDLHLEVQQPERVERFERYLAGLHGRPVLVILGDLFEFWFGDAQGSTPGGERALKAVADLSGSGCAVEVIHGNRDFLLGDDFARATGARVHPHGLFAALRDERGEPPEDESTALLIHGDELCTRDTGYQRLRLVLRSGPIGWLSRRVPRGLAERLAQRLRRSSRRSLSTKPSDHAQQQVAAAEFLAGAERVELLVCGHAHRWREEELLDSMQQDLRWVVLDDWGQAASDGRPVRDALEVDRRGRLVPRASGYGARVSDRDDVVLSSPASMGQQPPLIVAIDGPAGAGKSTVARKLAGELGLPFLDTGAMYRAVTLRCLERNVDPTDARACAEVAEALDLDFEPDGRITIDGEPGEPAIRSREVEQHVSQVAAHAEVRTVVVAQQQRIGAGGEGLVAEGRDTTTVVFPAATFKFFLWASPEARANRRALQLGDEKEAGRILDEILARDAFDTGREVAPLRRAEDAVQVDADHMSADQVARAILDIIRGDAPRDDVS